MFPVPSPASTSVPMTQNSNGVIILITLLNILVYKLQQLQEAKFTEQTNQLSLSLQKLCRRFSLRDIRWATFNFHDELVIGQGGFGKVYKGIIDFGATTVAIKRLESRSKQGSKEFLTEIEMLSKFQHSHLVSLVGYCDDRHEMILVYEYMPCGTLADHLHKRVRKGDTSSPPLSWEQRLKICIGAARGLDYLHTGTSVQHRVIHRDVKSSNILLDENMAAKISDFGLSKIGPSNQPFSTYVSTHVKGTPGYLDPYYFATHTLTRKSDVYGLGVVLFEALCGRRAVDNSLEEEQRGLAGWAQHCFKEGLLEQIIDPSIKGKILPNSLVAFVRVAIQCLHNAPKHRPTMAEVVVGLESALALQERGTIYTLVETPITNCDQVNVNANSSKLEEQITKYNQEHVDSSMVGGNQGNLGSPMVEVENANHNQENKNCSLEEGVINDADRGHHDEQSPARMTFTEKIGLFLFGKARMFSGHSDAKPSRNRRNNNNRIMAPNLKMFTLAELRKATRGFKPNMMLGKGGFGKVYKGWVHENTYAPSEFGVGMAIAVKRLRPASMQGFEDWQTEIKVLGNCSHPNLVKLLGYCQEDKELLLVYEYMQKGCLFDHLYSMISALQHPHLVKLYGCCIEGNHLLLVYEYMENNSLAHALFGTEEFLLNLDWPTRYKICIGIARGLAYLHKESRLKIVHRDIKATNVLLDKDLNPKISNFGLAKLNEEENTHISTRVAGTIGYMAPEYAMQGYLTDKADVYSFGIVALEILSGRRNTSFRPKDETFYLLDWAFALKEKGSFMELVDERLGSEFNQEEVMVMINVALQCVSASPKVRPAMSSVVSMLEG